MLGVISRARSGIDTITIDVGAGGTRLPGQSQSSGVGVLRKQSGNDQQRRGKPAALEKPCKTMEVIVNAVVLSRDRACRGIRHAKKNHLPGRRDRLEINLSGHWPIFRSLKNPRSLNFTDRKRLKGFSLPVALSTFHLGGARSVSLRAGINVPGQASQRVKGIEPSCPAWEAGILPLNYTRKVKK